MCVALGVYGTLLVLLVLRLTRMLIVCVLIGTPRKPPPLLISIADGQVYVLGHPIPLLAVVGAAAIPPLWWWAARVYDARLRGERERLGQCLECGRPLCGNRGRCPGCGDRFERSFVRERIALVTPRKTRVRQ